MLFTSKQEKKTSDPFNKIIRLIYIKYCFMPYMLKTLYCPFYSFKEHRKKKYKKMENYDNELDIFNKYLCPENGAVEEGINCNLLFSVYF